MVHSERRSQLHNLGRGRCNGSQRVGGGHVWPCPLDSPNGKLGLAQVILTGCQGIPKSLPDDVLKVRVRVGMRAQLAAKEKPRR